MLHDIQENKCQTFHGAIDLKETYQHYLSDQYADNVKNSKDPSEDAASSPLQYHSATAVQIWAEVFPKYCYLYGMTWQRWFRLYHQKFAEWTVLM